MKILITGAHGFVGNRLMQDLDDTVAVPSMRGMSEEQIRNMIEKSRADVIIHTAAISDVGTCEKDPGHLMKQMCVCRCFWQKQRKNKN